MRKKMGNILLALCLFISTFPGNIQAKAVESSNEQNKSGYVESNIKIIEQPSGVIKAASTLPSSFDLREEEGVTSVKNQVPYGTCWAFASIASVESNFKYTTGKEVDLSEGNLAIDRLGIDSLNRGGNYSMSTSYFANGSGPVLEKDDPYPSDGMPVKRTAQASYNVDNSLLVPSRTGSLDNDKIKKLIMDNGAVAVSYYQNESNLAADKVSYYYNGTNYNNHGVSLVGWDDNYPKEKFQNTPAGNGAFIVKNSWGKSYGNDGYFYISYYDTGLGYGDILSAKNMESVGDVDNRYSYGNYSINYRYLASYVSDQFIANVNTAKNNELLSAISTYTFSTNVPYEIYIDENYMESNYPNGDISYLLNKKRKSGTLEYAGLNTINLDTPIEVQPGKRFMVALKYKDTTSLGLDFTSDIGNGNSYSIKYNQLVKRDKANPLTVYSYDKVKESATGINVDKTSLTLKISEKSKLNASVVGNQYTSQKLEWTSSNTKVAVVDEDGVVSGRGNGNATITVSNRSGSIKRTVNVSINTNLSILSKFSTLDKDEKYIVFDDSITSGVDYSNITLKDKNGRILPISTRIENRRLYIKIGTKYLGTATLYIPKNAFVNKVNKGLTSDVNIDVAVNNYDDTDIIALGSKDISEAVANQLYKAENEITYGDLKSITSLSLYGDNIDFKDIWMLSSLYDLTVSSNGNAKNQKDLTFLQNMEYVKFDNVNMINLEYLRNNTKLTDIIMDNCKLYSLEGIEKLTKVYNAKFRNNYINNLKGIEKLSNLNYLYLDNNQITDISPLGGCTELDSLNLSGNEIASINGVENLKKLYTLQLDHNYIKDLTPLEQCINLNSINIQYNEVQDLTPIKNLADSQTSSDTAYLYVDKNYINSNDSIMNYLNDTKGWMVSNYQQWPDLYVVNDSKISYSTMNSKNDLTLTFNKEIGQDWNIKFYTYDDNADPVDIPFRVDGNNIYVDNKFGVEGYPTSHNLINVIDYTDENGGVQEFSNVIPMPKVGFYTEDVNKDNAVDIADLAEVASHYNERALGEVDNWQYNRDTNLDGIIDIYDLAGIAKAL